MVNGESLQHNVISGVYHDGGVVANTSKELRPAAAVA
jgi:hypothetical protein